MDPEHAPTGIEAIVCADIARRQKFGEGKYGFTVQDNPLSLRSWLQHAYEETLDQAVYLRRAIAEIDAGGRKPVVICIKCREKKPYCKCFGAEDDAA